MISISYSQKCELLIKFVLKKNTSCVKTYEFAERYENNVNSTLFTRQLKNSKRT